MQPEPVVLPVIDGTTRIVGIVAHPIEHVQTPQVMNRLFAETGTKAVIVPMHVVSEDLAGVVAACRKIRNMAGLIVTIPHKIAAARLCDELGEAGRMIGAVNSIQFLDSRCSGDMFDGEGFVRGVRNAGINLNPNIRAYLVGAGGTARAIAFGLLAVGIRHLTLYNRTRERAQGLLVDLAQRYPAADIRLGGPDVTGHDLIINATAAGLKPDDPLPLETSTLAARMVVAEVVAEPHDTKFLVEAKAAGCQVVRGRNMLEAQIALLAAHVLNAPELGGWTPNR